MTAESLTDRIHAAAAAGRVLVMGVVNVTPDSFSDGGRHDDVESALAHAKRLAAEGADILDIGGESTRPGAEPVSVDDELARVLPVIDAIGGAVDRPVSIDTMKPEVMREAVAHGAAMINDVNGLRDPEALRTVAGLDVPVCIMHMQGEPRTMQQHPAYDDVIDDLLVFFRERIAACREAGIGEDRLVLDPGFGFGKSLDHNLRLLDRFARFRSLGVPLLAGLSRKSMLGPITGRQQPDERVAASVAAALMAAERGADIVRVHDVAATVDAIAVLHAVRESGRRTPEAGETHRPGRPRAP